MQEWKKRGESEREREREREREIAQSRYREQLMSVIS